MALRRAAGAFLGSYVAASFKSRFVLLGTSHCRRTKVDKTIEGLGLQFSAMCGIQTYPRSGGKSIKCRPGSLGSGISVLM